MNLHEGPEPACAVRAYAGGGALRLHTRNHTIAAEGQLSFAPRSEHPSALDYLVCALAADLISGLSGAARRAGVTLDELELNLSARFENPLAALGVVGESGSARIAALHGTLYVGTNAPAAQLDDLWQRALKQAPVYSTLVRAATIDITLQLVS